jgi:hypothetical protein
VIRQTFRERRLVAAAVRTVGAAMSKVFGIGLNKTGITSLAACFVTLGLRNMSCRPDLLARYRRGDSLAVLRELGDCDSFEDWPFPLMYRELFYHFGPDAKFVLTRRRDTATWLDSLKRYSLRTDPAFHSRLLAYGYSYPHGVERHHIEFYERHNFEVREFFRRNNAEDRLLDVCWETGDGWPELCAFLGQPVPDLLFPHENQGDSIAIDAAVLAANHDHIRRQLILLGQPP